MTLRKDLLYEIILTGKIVWQKHALQRMMERNIPRTDVKKAIIDGVIIESYTQDKPLPSVLIACVNRELKLHVVTAYDFELGGQSEFDDVITIAIPYDAKYAEVGAESECVGAKYYNQATGEWEGVYYEVDAANRQVLIHTTHLSTYGVFQVKNENTRKAYITDVYAIAGLMNTGKSFEVIKELAEQGQPGNAAF